jgi:hypothetical protein
MHRLKLVADARILLAPLEGDEVVRGLLRMLFFSQNAQRICEMEGGTLAVEVETLFVRR